MKRSIISAILVLSTITTINHLQAEEAVDESAWKGNVELGYVSSKGNTETTSLNSKVNVDYKTLDWLQHLSAEAFTSSENNMSTAERYKLEYQADKKLDDDGYFFVNTTYVEDKFSGFDYRTTLSVGYGYKMYQTETMTLDTEVGVGYRQSKLSAVAPGDALSEDESLLRLAAKYNWDIEDNRKLTSKLTVEAGEESTISNFEIGFVTMIAGDLSLKVAYSALYTSEVPLDKEKLDTKTSINLLYAF